MDQPEGTVAQPTYPQGIGYLLILYRHNEDGSTGDIVSGEEAKRIGERLGLGEPSDDHPTHMGIWYIEP